MTLLDSLLDAILRLDGEALVMHAGEKPYVVLSSASMGTFRGPLSWGQVELSSRPLTTDAVLGMLAQMLSAEQSHELDEFGAIEQEIDAPGDSGERFVVTAARGGDDVWVEVRRRIITVAAPAVPQEEVQQQPSVAATEPEPVAVESALAHAAEPEAVGEPHGQPLIQVVAEGDAHEIALEEPEDVHEIHAIEEDLTAIVDEATGSAPIFEIASVPGFAIQTEASRVADEDEHEAEVFDIRADSAPGTELDLHSAPVFEIAQQRTSAEKPSAAESEREIAPEHPQLTAQRTRPVAQEPAAVIDLAEAGRAAAQRIGELAEQRVSEIAEQKVGELAAQKVSEIAELRVSEIAAQKVTDIAERKINAIAEQEVVRAAEQKVAEIAGQSVTEVAVQQVGEIAGRRVSEIAEQRIAEIAGQTVTEVAKQQVGELAEQRVTEVAEQKVIELAGHKVAEAAERQVAEIAKQTVTDVAEQRVGKIAEATVAALAEQRVAAVADQTVADVADERIGRIAEQKVAEVAERRVAEIAGQTVAELAGQRIREIADQALAAAAEQRVAEIAGQTVADVAAQQVAEIAGQKVTEIAQQRIAEIAERTVAALAEQRIGDIAEHRVAEIAARKVAEIAEQKVAEVAEQKVSAAAEQARAAESERTEATTRAPEFEAIPIVVPHARPAFRLHQLPSPPAAPSEAAPSEEAALVELLRAASAARASTVYAVVDTRPMMRVEGQISLVGTHASLASGDVERFIFEFAPRDQVENPAPEWTCTVPGVGRVRCVTFHDHSGAGLILHLPTGDATTADQLGIPAELQALCAEADGLVVVAGPRSSGKSMLLGVFVDLINRTRYDHVITIESQITKVHEKRLSFISQREVRGDGEAIAAAARAALREGPDVLVIEDLRAPEALTAALDAARAGRLVFGSISARTAPAAIGGKRVDQPLDRRAQVRASLAGSLRAVVAQLLVAKAGGGRTAAREVLLSSPPVRKLVLDGAIEQLPIAIESGRSLGMRTLVDSLGALVRDGIVDIADACACAPDRSALIAALERDGVDVTGVERRA